MSQGTGGRLVRVSVSVCVLLDKLIWFCGWTISSSRRGGARSVGRLGRRRRRRRVRKKQAYLVTFAPLSAPDGNQAVGVWKQTRGRHSPLDDSYVLRLISAKTKTKTKRRKICTSLRRLLLWARRSPRACRTGRPQRSYCAPPISWRNRAALRQGTWPSRRLSHSSL